MAKRLPVVELSDGNLYFVDEQLSQVRQVDNPHNFSDFTDLSEDDFNTASASIIEDDPNESFQGKLEELKALIKLELDACEPEETPTVCEAKQDPEGYERLEQMIINKIMYEGITVSNAIINVEREFNPNLQND